MFGIEIGAIIVGALLLISGGVVIANMLNGLPWFRGKVLPSELEELAGGFADSGIVVGGDAPSAGAGGADGGGGAGGGD